MHDKENTLIPSVAQSGAGKTATCCDCGSPVAYRTKKPKRCRACINERKRLYQRSRPVDLEKNRAADKERYRKKRAALGKTVKVLQKHDDQSEEAKRLRQNETCRRYRERNPEKRRESANAWAARNRQAAMQRFVERYHSDPVFNAAIKIRRRIHMALRKSYNGGRKSDTTINLLGCSYSDLKKHIERQFSRGMTWDKCFSGEIHFDHIRPCSSFDLSDPAQQAECFHYLNLRPMWGTDNIRKRDKRTHLI